MPPIYIDIKVFADRAVEYTWTLETIMLAQFIIDPVSF